MSGPRHGSPVWCRALPVTCRRPVALVLPTRVPGIPSLFPPSALACYFPSRTQTTCPVLFALLLTLLPLLLAKLTAGVVEFPCTHYDPPLGPPHPWTLGTPLLNLLVIVLLFLLAVQIHHFINPLAL